MRQRKDLSSAEFKMYIILLKTQDFMDEFAQIELKNMSCNFNVSSPGVYEIVFDSKKELFDFAMGVIYYSRTIENIYLEDNGEQINLAGFKLTYRDYKLNVNDSSLNPLLVNYCFFLLGLDKEKDFSLIDPVADLGDIVIESSIFNPRVALNVKKRHELALVKILRLMPKISLIPKSNNKILAVVQENRTFKFLRENINYSGQKIRISQYELDWLDVKFHKNDFDYIMSQFPLFENDSDYSFFQKEFFYQAEFICKKKICVISRKEINEKYLRKNRLRISIRREILVNSKSYYIYVIR